MKTTDFFISYSPEKISSEPYYQAFVKLHNEAVALNLKIKEGFSSTYQREALATTETQAYFNLFLACLLKNKEALQFMQPKFPLLILNKKDLQKIFDQAGNSFLKKTGTKAPENINEKIIETIQKSIEPNLSEQTSSCCII